MSLSDNLITMLAADPALFALVSSRVYSRRLPKTPTFPAVVYTRISTPREHTHGSSTLYPSWQFTCWSTTTKEAGDVATALENALNHRSWGDLNVLFVEGRIEGYEPDTQLSYVISTIAGSASKE